MQEPDKNTQPPAQTFTNEPSLESMVAPFLKEQLKTPDAPRPPRPGQNSGVLKSLRTYQGDVEEILAKTNGSVSSIALAEQKRKEERRLAFEAEAMQKQEEARIEKEKIAEEKALRVAEKEAEENAFLRREMEAQESDKENERENALEQVHLLQQESISNRFKPETPEEVVVEAPPIEPEPVAETPPPPPLPPPPPARPLFAWKDTRIGALPTQTSIGAVNYNRMRDDSEMQELTNHEGRNKFFVSFSIFLVIVGAAALGVAWYLSNQNHIISVEQKQALVSYTKKDTVSTASSTRSALISTLSREIDGFDLPVNSVLYVNTIDRFDNPTAVGNTLQTLSPTIPQELVRALDLKYMFGVYSSGNNEPFIILRETDFGISFAAMIKWEDTMLADLGPIFKIADTFSSKPHKFEDESVQNKDLRIIKDATRKTIFLYSFIDKNTILITTNENTFKAVLGKYVSNQIAK